MVAILIRSNYKWYTKQLFHFDSPIVSLTWSPIRKNEFTILSQEGCLNIYEVLFAYHASGSNYNFDHTKETGWVAVVDNANI